MRDLQYEYNPEAPPTQNGNGNARRDVIEFQANVPVKLSLKYAKPKLIETKRGIRYMLTTSENRVAFLDAEAALKIEQLEVKPNEIFWVINKGGKLGGWDVYLDPATERARDQKAGAVPKTTPAPSEVPIITSNVTSQPSKIATPALPTLESANKGWQCLVDRVNAAVDAYAECVEYATKYSTVTPDDVKSIFLSVYINGKGRG